MEIVTSPLHESRLHWIHDPNPNQSHRVKPKQTVPRNNNNNNTVPRNNIVRNSDSISRNPLDPIPSTSWYNSSLSVPSASSPRNSVYSHSRSVPRINKDNTSTNKMSAGAKCSSPPPKKRRSRKGRIERRARERENRNSSFIHDARWANQRTAIPGSPVVPARVTQSLPEAVDPISPMRTAVYPPSRIVGDSPTNENSPFQIGLESSRIPGLYKPADPDQQQDTWTNDLGARSSGLGPPLPTRTLRARSSGTGIGQELYTLFSRVGDALMCV